jgi:hypothetical protein
MRKTKKKPGEKVPAAPAVERTVDEERDETLRELLRELRARAHTFKPLELVGGIRTLLQERTAAESLVDADPGSDPAARAGAEGGPKATRRA